MRKIKPVNKFYGYSFIGISLFAIGLFLYLDTEISDKQYKKLLNDPNTCVYAQVLLIKHGEIKYINIPIIKKEVKKDKITEEEELMFKQIGESKIKKFKKDSFKQLDSTGTTKR